MRLWIAVCVAALAASTTHAQNAPVGAASAGDAVLSRALDEDASPDGYRYQPDARRDPFTNLRTATGPVSVPSIEQLALVGIVKTGEGYSALVVTPDARSVRLRTGVRLYDGVVVAIDDQGITFRQDVTDPLSTVRTRDVRKTLRP